jgi:tRNA threonylcarbamoyladenosine biosynthesis protein TsaE
MEHYFLKFASFCVMTDIHFTLDSIVDAAKEVASLLRPGLPLLLYGEMGAGKTTLSKYAINALGCEEEVTSPTFTIMQSYATQAGPLWHVDLYRLEEQPLDELGLDELCRGAMMIIEWPQRLGSRLFPRYIKGVLSVQQDGSRMLSLEIIE